MRKIRESGEDGHRHFERDNAFSNIKRVHHGADYVKTVRDSAGRVRQEPHEVKKNNSPLSKLQKKTHGLKVDRYVDTPYGPVRKTENRNGEEIKQDPFTGKWKKVRKRDNSGFSGQLGYGGVSKSKKQGGFDSMLGLGGNSSRPRNSNRSRNSSGFDSMLGLGGGSGGSRSSPRRKSNDYGFGSGLNDMFGSGGSSKKRRSSSGWGF